MRNSLLVCFLLIMFGKLVAQENTKLLKQLNKEADFISTDRLGNLYVVKKNFIWMYNKEGDSLRAFNSQRYGNISHLDSSDPYKLLVFFEDYNLVLFLDNYLSQNGDVIDMQSIGFDQVTLSCHSREAGFWAFDQIRQKVMHLNDQLEVTHETVNFMQWFGRRLNPNFILEYNNRLYLNEAESGIYVFDHFGTYLKKIALKGLNQPQVLENQIVFTKDNQLCSYDNLNMESRCKDLKNHPKVEQVRIEKGRLYVFTGKSTFIYSVN